MGGNVASGDQAVAMGGFAESAGKASFAAGLATRAEGQGAVALGSGAAALHDGSFAFGNGSSPQSGPTVRTTTENQFVVRAQHVWLGQDDNVPASPANFLGTSTGPFLTIDGAWTNSSDRARKQLFLAQDPDWVLGRLADLRVQEWSYRAEDPSVRHLGPTAQDFYAAFGLGGTDKAISTVEADGVALPAIQALERRTRELEEENAALRRRLEAVERALLDRNR